MTDRKYFAITIKVKGFRILVVCYLNPAVSWLPPLKWNSWRQVFSTKGIRVMDL